MSGKTKGTALIVGASRGLGYALAEDLLRRGWDVIGTVRATGGEKLAALAQQSNGRLRVATCDITSDTDLVALRKHLHGEALDLLFINAGVSNGRGETIAGVSTDSFVRIMTTNALAPLRTLECLEDLVAKNGILAVMSSGLGSVTNNTTGGWESYRASKAALNTLMRSFSARHAGDTRAMVLVAPGWVRTDMGGPAATLGIEESIPLVVDTVLAQAGQPGLKFLDRFGETVPW
ncbi:MAG: SDR family NAD(P)-dependent oxidoreductase [Hyphomicrobiaceae bacterium]